MTRRRPEVSLETWTTYMLAKREVRRHNPNFGVVKYPPIVAIIEKQWARRRARRQDAA